MNLAALRVLTMVLLAMCGKAFAQEAPAASPERIAEYRVERAKSILELQQFRHVESLPIDAEHRERGLLSLINLHPAANAWFLLTVPGPAGRTDFHIENPEPKIRRLALRGGTPKLVTTDPAGEHACEPWAGKPSALEEARRSGRPYAPLCEGRLYLRNATRGSRTALERATDFLRDEVWGGEAIVGFVRDRFFRDAFVEHGIPAKAAAEAVPRTTPAPALAAVDAHAADRPIQPGTLGIALEGTSEGLVLGRWYEASGLPGVYVSAMRPEALAPAALRGRANALDGVEASAIDHLIAFDLSAFDVGFALGTDHPRLGWSPRPPPAMRDPALPGPDGIAGPAPLVTLGMLPPALAREAVATFTGGFKREHGAFRYGPLAAKNHGSHYGFIEQGVVLSKLQPGLATLLVLVDGTVDMKTWSEADEALLRRVRHARQNGVALVEMDPASGTPQPGALVTSWGPGNWSGSADEQLRTLRAGACLQENGGRRFLVYGYFSTATPSAMARVFQAYRCRYAMLLDMNALEHTYLAVYVPGGDKVGIEHLVRGMEQIDKVVDGRLVPRFVGYPDNRDFFYLTRRSPR